MSVGHYYDIKYPYLNYPFIDMDGNVFRMYSVPVVGLVQLYRAYIGSRPYSFFDCGCATGELLKQAEEMGINAIGIDIKLYPLQYAWQQRYVDCGLIQIKSVLDIENIDADLAYCNGTLTYMNAKTLPLALEKFRKVNMLIAIHNTTEDVRLAASGGWKLACDNSMLIRSRKWWLDMFRKNGFDAKYNQMYGCFCATPQRVK